MEDNNIMNNIEETMVNIEPVTADFDSGNDFAKGIATGTGLVLVAYGVYKLGKVVYRVVKNKIQEKKGEPIETTFVDENDEVDK